MAHPHDQALTLMTRAHREGRLAHAYLISGQHHQDLERFAADCISAITGQRASDLEECSARGAIILRPQSKSRRIRLRDDSGEAGAGTLSLLQHHIQRSVAADGWKLGVIVDAERMTVEAQNAFLKTLEEPPPRTLLLLLSTQPSQLLSTTRSRVIEVALQAPSQQRSFDAHEQRLIGLLNALAARGGGSVAEAMMIKAEFQSILENIEEELSKQADDDMDRDKEHYGKSTDAGAWLKRREKEAEAQSNAGYLLKRSQLIDMMLCWLGDIARQQAGSTRLDLEPCRDATGALAQRWTPHQVQQRLRGLRQLETHLHSNVNETLALDACFLQAFGGD
jgi:DNA polymerase-3 subunit delta'